MNERGATGAPPCPLMLHCTVHDVNHRVVSLTSGLSRSLCSLCGCF